CVLVSVNPTYLYLLFSKFESSFKQGVTGTEYRMPDNNVSILCTCLGYTTAAAFLHILLLVCAIILFTRTQSIVEVPKDVITIKFDSRNNFIITKIISVIYTLGHDKFEKQHV
ncbi:hypothetical protein ACJX0J_013025, partial [Zea mays]